MPGYELHLPSNVSSPRPLILILPILGRLLFLPDIFKDWELTGKNLSAV